MGLNEIQTPDLGNLMKKVLCRRRQPQGTHSDSIYTKFRISQETPSRTVESTPLHRQDRGRPVCLPKQAGLRLCWKGSHAFRGPEAGQPRAPGQPGALSQATHLLSHELLWMESGYPEGAGLGRPHRDRKRGRKSASHCLSLPRPGNTRGSDSPAYSSPWPLSCPH